MDEVYFFPQEDKALAEIGDGNYQRSAVRFLGLVIMRSAQLIVAAIDRQTEVLRR